MNEHMEELLSQYLDEELDDETTAYVREQLLSNPEWQEALEELQTTVQAIRGLPSEATPERELWPEIVERRNAAAGAGAEPKQSFWTTPRLLAAGLAALLVPGAGLAVALTLRVAQQPDVVEVRVAPRACSRGGVPPLDDFRPQLPLGSRLARQSANGMHGGL